MAETEYHRHQHITSSFYALIAHCNHSSQIPTRQVQLFFKGFHQAPVIACYIHRPLCSVEDLMLSNLWVNLGSVSTCLFEPAAGSSVRELFNEERCRTPILIQIRSHLLLRPSLSFPKTVRRTFGPTPRNRRRTLKAGSSHIPLRHPLRLSKDTSSDRRYNLRKRKDNTTKAPKEPTPDPFPCAPPVIILSNKSNKRPASASPPRSPPTIKTTSSNPNSTSSVSPTTNPTTQSSVVLTPAIDNSEPSSLRASYFSTQPAPSNDKAAYHKHIMGSKASKLAPSHGKLQPSQDKQDKAEMKEPSNYYTHRSKSMRRKAGKEGATDAGAAGGGVGGTV